MGRSVSIRGRYSVPKTLERCENLRLLPKALVFLTAEYGINEGIYSTPPLVNEDLEQVYSYVLNEVQSFKKDHPGTSGSARTISRHSYRATHREEYVPDKTVCLNHRQVHPEN